MSDMSAVIVPKSDQISGDDLIAGPMTIRITEVTVRPGTEQPVTINYDGSDGRPWKPCKSMARVLVAMWGPDSKAYSGKSLTLYRDPSVKWGGMEVGGIRISHMSDIDGIPAALRTMALTATKGSKKLFKVLPLKVEAPAVATAAPDKAADTATALADRIKAAPDMAALQAITAEEVVIKQRAWMADKRPELADKVDAAVKDALARLGDFPGVATPREEAV